MKRILLLLLFASLLFSCSKSSEGGGNAIDSSYFKAGSGVFTYNQYAPLSEKPVRIFYNIPADGNAQKMPVLFVMHGTDRNANDYLNAWKTASNNKKFMVFVVEYNLTYFPEAADYNQGGMYSNGKLLPEAQWSFSYIENIFDFIVKELKSTQTTYDIWGHSAGAQFVHRYLLFKPKARINRAVAANAGWYTLPDLNKAYPYGLKNSPATSTNLKEAFAKKFSLHLGTADVNVDKNLNTSSGAMEQGKNRFERGNYFWTVANTQKASYTVFNWQKLNVPDVAHEYKKMAEFAAKVMY